MPLSDSLLSRLQGMAVMLVGQGGTGKTFLARELAERLSQSGPAALLGADMGQAAFGVPTCMSVSCTPPFDRAEALWFVGDVTPLGNLVPVVAGVARLADWARQRGARSIVLDTTGLVEGPVSRVLKYHKLLSARIDCVAALERDKELEELLWLLSGAGAPVERLEPSPLAVDRSMASRQTWRQERYREHFKEGVVREFSWDQVVTADWSVGRSADAPRGLGQRVVGLLDWQGICQGLGIVVSADSDRLRVLAACDEKAAIGRVQVGRIGINPLADFAETR